MKRQKGFTLIELLVVVAIIGILAAIAIPNLLLAIQRSKQRRTMVDIKSIATAWEARNVDTNRYNAAGGVEGADTKIDIATLQSFLQPTYIKSCPSQDGWGRDFAAFVDYDIGADTAAAKYAVISGGHDGSISPDFFKGPFTNYDCDIVFSNGTFVSFPEGLGLK